MSKEAAQQQFTGFLNTPPLWQGYEFDVQQFEFPEMKLTNFIPENFPNNIRLGHQMEYVFKQLIDYSKRYEILLYNLPVRDKNRTMGEIDFILKDVNTEQLIHVELTYKFYILDFEIKEPIHQLIGPNRGDAFFTKLHKIKNKQFKLIHSKEGIKALKLNNIDHSKITHQVCYKTQLFKPKNTNNQITSQLNSNCIIGYWLPFKDFNSIEYSNFQFYIPSKSEWVIDPHQNVPWKNYTTIKTDIYTCMEQQKSPMVWMKKPETIFEKFFVIWW